MPPIKSNPGIPKLDIITSPYFVSLECCFTQDYNMV